jgi:hypothetical protein
MGTNPGLWLKVFLLIYDYGVAESPRVWKIHFKSIESARFNYINAVHKTISMYMKTVVDLPNRQVEAEDGDVCFTQKISNFECGTFPIPGSIRGIVYNGLLRLLPSYLERQFCASNREVFFMDTFILNIIHRPKLVPEYIDTSA